MATVPDDKFEGRNIREEVQVYVKEGGQKKAPPTEKEITPVIKGTAHKKQDSIPVRFLKELIPNGNIPLKDYLLNSVIVPTTRNTILNIIHMMFGVKPLNDTKGRTDFTQYYKSPSSTVYPGIGKKRAFNCGYQPITVETRQDAQAVLDQMRDILEDYEWVTVMDLYQMVGIPTTSTDNRFGWNSIVGARLEYRSDGFRIVLPDPLPVE